MTSSLDAYLLPTWRDAAGRFSRWNGEERLRQLVKEAGEETTRALRQATPVRTGRAQAGWRATYLVGETEARIANRVPYVAYLVTGTRPHEIRPRTASVLAFIGASGEQVFARSVMHPGSKPSDQLMQAIADVPERVRVLVGKAGVEIRRSLEG
jgi:hypothetical protein